MHTEDTALHKRFEVRFTLAASLRPQQLVITVRIRQEEFKCFHAQSVCFFFSFSCWTLLCYRIQSANKKAMMPLRSPGIVVSMVIYKWLDLYSAFIHIYHMWKRKGSPFHQGIIHEYNCTGVSGSFPAQVWSYRRGAMTLLRVVSWRGGRSSTQQTKGRHRGGLHPHKAAHTENTIKDNE